MYNDSFWDTMKGQQLASILCEYLPPLADALSKNCMRQPQQIVMTVGIESVEFRINQMIRDGYRLYTHINERQGKVILVFEK